MTTIATIITQLERFPKLRHYVEGGKLWVKGNTFQYRNALRKMGLLYAEDKKQWYWEEGGADKPAEPKQSRFPIRSKKYKSELTNPND